VNRSEILIIRYRSTTVVSISQDQAVSPIVNADTNNDWTEIDAQTNQKSRLTSLHRKRLAGWANQLINRLFRR